MPKHEGLATVQKWIKGKETGASMASLAHMFIMSVGATLSTAPRYGSRYRDRWLSAFWKRPGCDLLAGAISTMVAKIVSTSWYIDGPLSLAMLYRDIFLHRSQFGAGWDEMLAPWVTSYIDQDFGGTIERHRTSIGDHDGPALGFAHLDESLCRLTGKPGHPIAYSSGDGKERKMHRSQVARIVDMASPQERYKGNGYCSVGRAITTALILCDIARYKRERLSDLPPAALLLLNNLTEVEWEDIMANYDARQRNEGNTTWRDIIVACGIDPEYPITAELFEFSRLPEHYNEKTCVEIAVYTFALALRFDARELWPVSAGPLGTSTETEIMHIKAKAKGPGIIYTAIERQLNSPFSIPQILHFRFDYRDDEEDMLSAQIAHQKIKNIRLMWETSPNRGDPLGIITTEQAQQLLIREGMVPPEILGLSPLPTTQVYDVRMYGPPARVYRDGRVLPL